LSRAQASIQPIQERALVGCDEVRAAKRVLRAAPVFTLGCPAEALVQLEEHRTMTPKQVCRGEPRQAAADDDQGDFLCRRRRLSLELDVVERDGRVVEVVTEKIGGERHAAYGYRLEVPRDFQDRARHVQRERTRIRTWRFQTRAGHSERTRDRLRSAGAQEIGSQPALQERASIHGASDPTMILPPGSGAGQYSRRLSGGGDKR
jgi:hypothetical protein